MAPETLFPLTWTEFERIEMRVGTILEAQDFPEAQNPPIDQ